MPIHHAIPMLRLSEEIKLLKRADKIIEFIVPQSMETMGKFIIVRDYMIIFSEKEP